MQRDKSRETKLGRKLRENKFFSHIFPIIRKPVLRTSFPYTVFQKQYHSFSFTVSETKCTLIAEFVGLKPNIYSFIKEDNK